MFQPSPLLSRFEIHPVPCIRQPERFSSRINVILDGRNDASRCFFPSFSPFLSLFSLSLFVFSFSFFSRCFFLSPMKRGCFPPRHRAAGNGSWTRMKTFHGRWLIVDIARRVFLVSSFQRNSLPPPKFFRIMMFAR